MSRTVLDAVERLARELTVKERRQLVRDLTRRTRSDRWNRLFAVIDERVRRYGAPSEEAIIRLCREVRRGRVPSRRRP